MAVQIACSYLATAMALVITAVLAQGPSPTVPTPGPGAQDPTPPLARVDGIGFRNNFSLNQDSFAPESRRIRSGSSILLIATASDSETGIRRVSLRGERRITCVARSGQTTTFMDPVAEDRTSRTGSTLPVELVVQVGLSIPDQGGPNGRCRNIGLVRDLRLEVQAEAENGLGQTRRLPAAIITFFGPDVVRVGTFNLYRPGNHADTVYVDWGRTLGAQTDVLLLTEVEDRRRAELLASAAGMPNVVMFRDSDSDIAIASRTPLRSVERRTIDPPGRLSSGESNVLSVVTDLRFYPHQFIVSHWGIRGSNDEVFGPERSSPWRLMAAETIVSLLAPPPGVVILGGDFNAYSGVGPQDHDNNVDTPDHVGSTAEVDRLRSLLTDPFTALKLTNEAHCSNQRIDYVLIRGYVATGYQACSGGQPSDHPFVLVTLEAE